MVTSRTTRSETRSDTHDEARNEARTPDGTRDEALAFVGLAVDETVERLPTVDRDAMELVLLLHRVTNSVVYDLESTVHRPAGWSWSAFRAVFTLWISGPLEPSRLAERTGMSRQAVSSLTKTLENDGLVRRTSARHDARSVVLSLTDAGTDRVEQIFVDHNRREAEWAAVLDRDERRHLVRLLAKLADAAHDPWVNSRTVAPRATTGGEAREPAA